MWLGLNTFAEFILQQSYIKYKIIMIRKSSKCVCARINIFFQLYKQFISLWSDLLLYWGSGYLWCSFCLFHWTRMYRFYRLTKKLETWPPGNLYRLNAYIKHWRISWLKDWVHMLGSDKLFCKPSIKLKNIWELLIKKEHALESMFQNSSICLSYVIMVLVDTNID